MTVPKHAAFADGTPCPPYWEKLVLVAYMRLLGSTQPQAGAAVGRAARTVRTWEADQALWTRASEEARQRWLGEVLSLARRQLLRAMITADGDLSLKLLERLEPDLAPPSQRLKHEGSVALVEQAEWHEMRAMIVQALAAYPDARAELAEVLHDARNGTGT